MGEERENVSLIELCKKKPLLDGRFFKLIENESNVNGTIVAACQKCLPKDKKIKGTLASTSNFRTHLKRVHGEEIENYVSHKKKKAVPGHITRRKDPTANEGLRNNILRYIIYSFAPLSTIENQYFREIFNGLGYPVKMSRKTLCKEIKNYFSSSVNEIKKNLGEAKFVCTTADVWSTKQRGFLGITCHWINEQTYERHGIALACRRFKGSHSFDRISQLIKVINEEYNLSLNKNICTITDNGSNFVKAFRAYGIQNINGADEESCIFEEVTSVESTDHFLPMHVRCAAHTLHLIATVDTAKAIKISSIEKIHYEVMKQCNELWALCCHPKSAEAIKEEFGTTFSRPGVTRLNDFFKSLQKVNDLREKIQVSSLSNTFTEIHFNYIEHHVTCLKPLADALDDIQGEKNMFYGHLVPTLFHLRRQLQKLSIEKHPFSDTLLAALITNLEKRFTEIFNLTDDFAILAAFSLPKFKDRWMKCVPVEKRFFLRNKFIQEVIQEANLLSSTANVNFDTTEDSYDFGSEDDDSEELISTSGFLRSEGEIVALKYLSDNRREISMLDDYPLIKKIFLKYNTPLPSSAPVERLFSFATMFDAPKMKSLRDELFEQRVLLKANNVLKH